MLFGQEHVERYRETDGEEGYRWLKDTTILLLTTKGRRSGEERTTPLIFNEHDGDYLIVASNGGASAPGWYLNMQEEPEVEVQIKGERFRARGRDATAEEKPEMWRKMAASWPDYDEYQERADREIPVVVLERV